MKIYEVLQYFMKHLIFHEARNHSYDIMTFHYYHNKLLFKIHFYFITGSFRIEGQHGAAERRHIMQVKKRCVKALYL